MTDQHLLNTLRRLDGCDEVGCIRGTGGTDEYASRYRLRAPKLSEKFTPWIDGNPIIGNSFDLIVRDYGGSAPQVAHQ
jgi:hypothetical protein